MAMTGTRPDWMVQVHKGDVLALNTTYETKRASWYESMGISVVYMAPGDGGRDPYQTKVDWPGQVTHGHLPENNVHGGSHRTLPDPDDMSGGPFPTSNILIDSFTYGAGDFRLPGSQGRPARVRQGQSLTFQLAEGDASQEIWHSITSCAAPCNRNTGIGYPIANGQHQFDSGQLGDHTPAVFRRTWETPNDLPVGTYTYFCRIHPMMRGAFRVVPD
jgi:plastocyanin